MKTSRTASKIEELTVNMSKLSKQYLDRLEYLNEFIENEFVTTEFYNKSLENELDGLIKDIQNLILTTKGYN